MIEDVEDDIYEHPDSYFTKSSAVIFNKIYNGKDGVFPLSKFVDLIEALGEVFHIEKMVGHLRKVDPN